MAEKLDPKQQYESIKDSPVTPAPTQQPPQDPEDKHGANYSNDSTGWVRGMGPQSPHPKFDKGPSGNRYKK